MPRISAKHALSQEELKFCRVYVAFGHKNHTEAYRRAFLITRRGETYDPADDSEEPQAIPPKEVNRRASALLKQDYIQEYIAEIGRPTGDHARGVLAEQTLFGDETAARRAAEKVLEEEDKLGFRDAVEKWTEILCDVGAEIEVPLPERFQATIPVTCDCGKVIEVEIDEQIVVRAPMSEMFVGREG